MFNLIVNSLHFFVMAVGVWTIVCAIYKMPWVFALFFKKPTKKVSFDAWVVTYEDGYVGVYDPIHLCDDWEDTQSLPETAFLFDVYYPELKEAVGLTRNDEPVKVNITVEIKVADLQKAKKAK